MHTLPCSNSLRPLALALAIASILVLPVVATAADTPNAAADPQTLPEIVVQGKRLKQDEHAPTRGSLKATQPTSIIGKDYIDSVQSSAANYSDIIAIAPSVVNIQPNGPGLGDTSSLKIRGFKDGQFNLTWDGIPVGDANDFTHHSGDYLMPQDLGQVDIDRGPGSASTIGFATFGGTVGVHTKDPLTEPRTTLYGSYGSFATALAGAEFDTGVMHGYGDFSGFIDYRQLRSDGYLTGASVDRKNLFMKAAKPIGDHTLLTFVAMKNKTTGHSGATVGATSFPYVAVYDGGPSVTSGLPGQLQKFGNNHGLSNNPLSQAYTGYNHDDIATDLEYFGVQSRLGSIELDNKLYTFAYYHHGYNGLDPNGGGCDYGRINCLVPDGTFPAGADTPNGTVYGPNNIPGQRMYMLYRNWGDVLRFKQALGPGELRYGVWYDRQLYHRYQAEVDYSNDLAFNNKVPIKAIDRYINGTFVTTQPYLEYAWTITPQLTLTGGVKYVEYTRHDNAPIEQKTKTPLNYSQTWKKPLPSLDLHYMVTPEWSVYLQAAKGFLAPNEKWFYVPDPATQTQDAKAESTTNYQLGTVWRGDRASLAAAVYAINFSNKVQTRKIGSVKYFINIGGVRYRGAEIEGSYALGAGFSLYGNASYNKAEVSDTGLQLTGVPKITAAAGVRYRYADWTASLYAKYIGTRWGDTGNAANGGPINVYEIGPNTIANLAVHYAFHDGGWLPRGSTFGLQVFNLADSHKISDLHGYTAGNVPLFDVVAGRSIMGTISVALH